MTTPKISRVAPIGKRFGRLVVIGGLTVRDGTNARSVLCRCECGDERHHFVGNLRNQQEPMCPDCRTRITPQKGLSGHHPLMNIWKAMVQRCENSNHTAFALYGGRGIRMCQRWRADFEAFVADVGNRPSLSHTIDRKDVNGDYEPANCRWATPQEQQRNKRNNRIVQWEGKRLTLVEAAELAGISTALMQWRLGRGWSVAQAITQKKRIDRRTAA
jgi:hypothetical protein